MKKLFFLLCCCLTMTPLSAQDLPSKAVYLAQKDSLSKEFAAAVDKWNKTIPPYYREAIRLEKEAKNHPEWKDSLLAAAAEKRRMGDSFKPELQARLDVIQAEKRALGDRYALIFEEAFSYFQRRKDFSKDSLAEKKGGPSGIISSTISWRKDSLSCPSLAMTLRGSPLIGT